ncbi:hypothetical protein WT98_04275 [Burkholderia territorii]|nr:hypothetical protein WT98_04275 [Burkholderia territorii]
MLSNLLGSVQRNCTTKLSSGVYPLGMRTSLQLMRLPTKDMMLKASLLVEPCLMVAGPSFCPARD